MENEIRLYDHSEPGEKAIYYSISKLGKFANTALGIAKWNMYLSELKEPYQTGEIKEINCELIPWQLKNAEIKKTKV